MGDRGFGFRWAKGVDPDTGNQVTWLAPVVDLDRHRRTAGTKVMRAGARRVNPAARPPLFDGTKIRRSGRVRAVSTAVLPRAVRRLAWKIEHRQTNVAWAESRAKVGELAPVVELRTRQPSRRSGQEAAA